MRRRYTACCVYWVALLSGCSWFSHVSPETLNESSYTINVEVVASDHVNPNDSGEAQPVKFCVFESNRSGWISEWIDDGTLCRDTSLRTGVLIRGMNIIYPGETRRYHFVKPARQESWVVIGAEFQQDNGVLPLVERKLQTQANSIIRVIVGMRALSIIINEKVGE